MARAQWDKDSGVDDLHKSLNPEFMQQDLEYDLVLNAANLSFEKVGDFLWVGDREAKSGWAIYITVIVPQFPKLMANIMPELMRSGVCFRIPENGLIHRRVLDGGYGFQELGKIVVIYPDDSNSTVSLAKKLIDLTSGYKGPLIPAAIKLDHIIYTAFESTDAGLTGPGEGALRKDARWPFKKIGNKQKSRPKKWLRGKYLIVQTIKKDAKGNVYKALHFRKWFDIEYVIIKQGNINQCLDDYGRDIKDRLKWQYELGRCLEGLIAVAPVIEYFEDEDDAYLVLQLIEGSTLNERVTLLTNGCCWFALDHQSKRKILNWIISIIDIVGKFHEYGYVHRDISPGNFLVSNNGSIVNIDIELAYDCVSAMPAPPFALGTSGYMSPRQMQIKEPVIADDIYGTGALIVKTMTGLSPGKFNIHQEGQIFESLLFFTESHALSSMITSCLSADETLRPGLESIRHTLQVYDATLLTTARENNNSGRPAIDRTPIKSLIQRTINSLARKPLTDDAGFWLSKRLYETVIANELQDYSCDLWFGNGIGGILYVLSLAERFNFDITEVIGNLYGNLDYLQLKLSDNLSHHTGFFEGSSGIAVTLNSLVQTGLIEGSITRHNQIFQLFNERTASLNLANGIAGKGLAMLYCSATSRWPDYYPELSELADNLLKAQNRDGSWTVKRSNADRSGIKLFGFLYGAAGILYFLLAYYSRHQDQKVRNSVVRGLDYLLKARKIVNGVLLWPISAINSEIDPSLDFGFSGIALTYIKAFDVLGDFKYKLAAQNALWFNPKYVVSNYLGVANGLAGLGEIYLEAYSVFKDPEYLERIDHVVHVLSVSYFSCSASSSYWHEANSSQPAADFLNGNSGIVHFLLHYLFQDKISFPLKIN